MLHSREFQIDSDTTCLYDVKMSDSKRESKRIDYFQLCVCHKKRIHDPWRVETATAADDVASSEINGPMVAS